MKVTLSKTLEFLSHKCTAKSGILEESDHKGLYILHAGAYKQILKQSEVDQILALNKIKKEVKQEKKEEKIVEAKPVDDGLEKLSIEEVRVIANELYTDLDKRLGKKKLIELIQEAKKEQ